MFGGHFYHAITRKTVSVFGTLFNSIMIIKRAGTSTSAAISDMQKVPLSYGPKQKFLSRIDDQFDLDDTKVALKLPRMSFEITGMTYDSTTKLSAFNKLTTGLNESDKTRTSVTTSVPYIIDMELNILAKNQDDALQIVEQILPYFQPAYNVAVKWIDGLEQSFDMPITLQSITSTDDYEGDYNSRKVLTYTLTFSIKTRYFSAFNTKPYITEADANLYKQDVLSSGDFLVGINVTPDGFGDTLTEYRTIASTSIVTIESTDAFSQVDFDVGTVVYGNTSGSEAVVVSATYDNSTGVNTIVVRFPDGYFLVGEDLVNSSTNNTIEIAATTVS